MQFQVPQNLDVPDTILWGLDFKQLLYLGGSVGLILFLLFFGGGLFSAILFGGPVLLLAIALSFVNFNRQPFIVVLQAVVRFFTKKKMYVWKQAKGDQYTQRSIKRKQSATTPSSPHNNNSEKVRDLSGSLIFDTSESGSDPEVII